MSPFPNLFGRRESSEELKIAQRKVNDLQADLEASHRIEKLMTSKCQRLRAERERYKNEAQNLLSSIAKLRDHTLQLKKRCSGINEDCENVKKNNIRILDQYKHLKDELQHSTERESRSLTQNLSLQHQISDLKKDIALMTQGADDITDDFVRAQMSAIFAKLQNFAVTYFRKCNLDVAHCQTKVQALLPCIAEDAVKSQNKNRTYFIVAIISEIMLQYDIELHFFGACCNRPATEANKFYGAFLYQCGDMDRKSWLKTVEHIFSVHHAGAISKAREELAHDMVKDVNVALVDATSIPWTKAMQDELIDVARIVLRFQRELQLQQTAFKVVHRHIADRRGESLAFLAAEYDDPSYTDDEERLEGRQIELAVFPGIMKTTDAKGKKLAEPLIVVKAKAIPSDEDDF